MPIRFQDLKIQDMKHIKNIFLACTFLALLCGCEKQEELATALAPENVVAPVMNAYTGGDIVVTADNQGSEAAFSWTPADFGVATGIQYSLYMKVDGGVAGMLKSTTEKSISVKYSELSIATLRAGGMSEVQSAVSVYVSAEIGSNYPPAVSQAITFRITPFEIVPPALHMVGNVLESDKEWNPGNYTYIMFRDENLSEEEIMVTYFRAGGDGGGFKFIPDETLGKWDVAYGQVGAGKLSTTDAGNINDIAVNGYYTVTANTSKGTYAVTPYDAAGRPAHTTVTFGSTALAQTAYDPHMWVAEDVKPTAGAAEYFSVDGTPYGAAGFPYGKATAGGDAIRAKGGNYFVKFSDLTGHYVFYETVDLSSVTPPVLSEPAEQTIIVSAANRGDKLAFSWTAAVFPVAGDITYTLYARLGDDGEAKAVDGSATTATSCDVTYGALNNAALAAGAAAETAASVQLFVKAVVGTAERASDPVTISITPVEFTYPDAVYMIGADFGGWNWSDPGIVALTPVHSHDGQFWCVRYFTAGQGFKWCTVKEWSGGDFFSLGTDVGYTESGGNAQVAADGFYSVYIDYTTNTITIEPAQVFGMGDCFGSWDKGQHPFTADGTVMKITTTNTETKELRMYAASSGAPTDVDWWQMEFVILDGQIEYRGTGGDQARVPVDAGKTVTLNFNAGTGVIE
jgi:hypothetical protein